MREWSHRRKTGPKGPILTIREVKEALRIAEDDPTHNEDLGRKLVAATEQFEADTDRACLDQTFLHYLSSMDDRMQLYKFPAHTIVGISYWDDDGNTQTVDPAVYALDAASNLVYRNYNQSWPSHVRHHNSVVIEYVAGNGDDQKLVPMVYKEAVIALIAAWWEDPIVGERYQQAYERIKDRFRTSLVWG